jgi:hypothetical protein
MVFAVYRWPFRFSVVVICELGRFWGSRLSAFIPSTSDISLKFTESVFV